MLKAVLFDMDGVIVDTEPLHHKAYKMMFDDVGIDVSDAMYRSFTGQSTRGICEFLCKHFELSLDPIVLEKGKRAHFTKLFFEDPDLQLLDGVEDLIKDYHANGLTLVVASSASMFTINNVMKRFNLDPYFRDKLRLKITMYSRLKFLDIYIKSHKNMSNFLNFFFTNIQIV